MKRSVGPMGGWKTTLPGSGAVDHMRQMALQWQASLERRDADAVHRALRSRQWRDSFDWNGVPVQILGQTDQLAKALFLAVTSEPPEYGLALRKVDEILGLW